MRSILLIIDAQNDFCAPTGSLSVPGAAADMLRLAKFIVQQKHTLGHILLPMDTHQYNDISHPYFWEDSYGEHPAAFTQITAADVKKGRWIARFDPKQSLKYLETLEANGDFSHVIWPIHCIEGSEGAAIYPPLLDAIHEWCKLGNQFNTLLKGQNPFTEHFGLLEANVVDPNDQSTQTNVSLINILRQFDTIYIAGEAKSHCVAYTLKQLTAYPDIIKKLNILENCMSVVTGFEHAADGIFETVYSMGARKTDRTSVS